MKITIACFILLTVFAFVYAQEPQASDDQVVIQALQGQAQYLLSQIELQKRTIQKLQTQVKDCKPPEKEQK